MRRDINNLDRYKYSVRAKFGESTFHALGCISLFTLLATHLSQLSDKNHSFGGGTHLSRLLQW